MSDRDALLDLQARWAAVGLKTFVMGTHAPFLSRIDQSTTWVHGRERWQIGTMPTEALRVFADWIQEGDATT